MRFVPFLLTLLTLSFASAHTEVTAVTPASGAAVASPASVSLTFSEPVNLHFCTFRVFPLPGGASTAAAVAGAAFAAPAGAAGRVDLTPPMNGLAARVRLPLKPRLKAGWYVVAWKLLSDDGHPVSGHSVFRVR